MKKCQAGAAIVEFALVCVLFLTVLLAIMDFGRILYMWNAAAEATRLGARLFVVCDQATSSAKILAQMQQFVPITASNLQIDWYAYDSSGKINISTTCDKTSCAGVAVSIKNMSITPLSPLAWIGFSSLNVPGFSTYLPREYMANTTPGVCS